MRKEVSKDTARTREGAVACGERQRRMDKPDGVSIVGSFVNSRSDAKEQAMSQDTFDQFNDLVTRLAAADGTLAAEHSPELLNTALAREMLEAIVGGQMSRYQNPYSEPPTRSGHVRGGGSEWP